MNYEQRYRRLISGQGGFGACLLRILLWIVSIDYSLVVRLRNLLYSKRWFKAHHVDAAVLCVGNITVGGTGKTPLVVWLYNQVLSNFKSQMSDFACAILTRGYKATQNSKLKTQNLIDEVGVLAESCPEAEVIVNPDRIAGAAEAIGKFGAKVLIMDDGFQHRRLARDLDIVAIDATQPFGYGKMLPAGLLREPVTSLKRAGAVVITRCNQTIEAELGKLEEKLRAVNPDLVIARSVHAAVSIQYAEPFVIPAKAGIQKDDTKMDSCFRMNDNIEQLKGKKVFAFCGIGNPDGFFNTVQALGCELVGSKAFDDHYHYKDACLADIRTQAEELGADMVLTTQKDWTKLISDSRFQISDSQSSPPFAYLTIEIQFLAGEDKLKGLIESTLAGKISQK
ncbi:MAG: tetraacyldisaccharide 4'-kinase [Planctomycetota bacterium]|jgi:tetraacyldisaccharide 4'-kinase